MIKPIPFTPLNKSIDKPSQSTFNQAQYDGFWQEYQSPDGIRYVWAKRPGLTLFKDLGTAAAVDGIHYWTRQDVAMAVSDTDVFMLESDATQYTRTGTGLMTAAKRPSFADVLGTDIYIASEGAIGQYDSGTGDDGAYIVDAGSSTAPTDVSHIATINQTLVALRKSSGSAPERFEWANAIAPDEWDGNYANNEAEPDVSRAMLVANNYLYFYGSSTMEPWYDDSTTFVRENQGVISVGTLAAYSVCNINGIIYSLDSSGEVSRLKGFTLEVISNPELTRYIKSFTTVSDAIGDYIPIEGRHFYVLSFPVEKKTLVFDIALNQWYEWSYWDSNNSEHIMYRGNCVTIAPEWDKVLVGDRANGKVYYVGGTTDNGDTIRTVLQTDFIDRGAPDSWKVCHELTLVFKRADTAGTANVMSINYRDQGEAAWSGSREFECEIENVGQTELKVNIRGLNKYKRRQWRFIMSDPTQAALILANERFTIGR